LIFLQKRVGRQVRFLRRLLKLVCGNGFGIIHNPIKDNHFCLYVETLDTPVAWRTMGEGTLVLIPVRLLEGFLIVEIFLQNVECMLSNAAPPRGKRA
jgi:hypothetical protein